MSGPKDFHSASLAPVQPSACFTTPGKFNVYRVNEHTCTMQPYNRRDYYKITLILGQGKLQYADRGIIIDKPALLLCNPSIPYSWTPSSKQQGYFCVFSDEFISSTTRGGALGASPLFRTNTDPLFFLPEESLQLLTSLFERMLVEMETDYLFKKDLMRSYVDLILHEAMKLQPARSEVRPFSASSRILSSFIEHLDRQFPIDSLEHAITLKTPHDFAEKLSVHVNHLNRVVKEITGRTTSEHISERIVKEAFGMLQHTSLNISQIAYCLGFDYPAHFTNFIKKQTGKTPGELRVMV